MPHDIILCHGNILCVTWLLFKQEEYQIIKVKFVFYFLRGLFQ